MLMNYQMTCELGAWSNKFRVNQLVRRECKMLMNYLMTCELRAWSNKFRVKQSVRSK